MRSGLSARDAGLIGVRGSLHPDVAIGAAIRVNEDCVPAPLLSEVELACAVRAWIRRRIDQATLFHRLVVLENLLQHLKASALVHERNAAVVWSHIIDRITCIYACTGEKIEGRTTGGTADASTGRSTAVNVLLVTQFVVVIRGVVALAGEEWLQAVLAADVHGHKLLAIFAREVIE